MEKQISNPNTCQVVPDDILEEILERIPEESLVRFKSVSKQWKSMIKSSYFAKKHLIRFPNPKLLVLRAEVSSDRCSRTLFLATISKDHHDYKKIIVFSYKFTSPYPDSYPDTFNLLNAYYRSKLGRIMGYCNGIVCIYDFGYIYLINPATRKLRILSPEFLKEYTCRPGWSSSDLPISVGFGRDIVTGTYKVILMYLYDSNSEINTLIKAEVFNLDNGKRKCICFPILYSDLSADKTSIFANGSLYWLTKPSSHPSTRTKKFGAIDLHTEKFRDVLLPSWYTKYSKGAYLWSLKDRLCLSDLLNNSNYVDVWSLQQEKPSVKWEKLLSVNISNMDCLDVKYWKLGLAADYFRTGGYNSYVMDDHNRTVLYRENLVSSV